MNLQHLYDILNCFCVLEIDKLLCMVYYSNVIDILRGVICLALSDFEIAQVFTVFVVVVVIVLEN